MFYVFKVFYFYAFISEVTPRCRNTDSEYCLMSEERNAVWKNPQQILVFCADGGPLDPRGPRGSYIRYRKLYEYFQ